MPTSEAIQHLILHNLKNVKYSIQKEELKNLSDKLKGHYNLIMFIRERILMNIRLFM